MGFIPWLLGGIVAISAFGINKVAKAALKLDYDIDYFRIDKSKTSILNGVIGTLGLKIYNPTEESILYEKFVGNLNYNSQRAGNLDPIEKNILIKARKQTTIPMEVTLPLSFFGNAISDILSSLLAGEKLSFTKNVSLNGFIKLKGLPNYEINKTFDIGKKV